MQHWIDAVQQIKTPLMLAGLVVVVAYFLYGRILRNPGPIQKTVARYVFILALAAIILSILVRFPPTHPNEIEGEVHEMGIPTAGIEGATVSLDPQQHGTIIHATSAKDGAFSFPVSEADSQQNARLWALKDGYEPDVNGQVLALQSFIDGKQKVEIQLKKLTRVETTTTKSPQSLIAKLAVKPLQAHVLVNTSLKVSSFYFIYQFDPPGRRDWSQFRDDVWLERYPNGNTTVFQVSGSSTVDGCTGTSVNNIQDKNFEVFIPNKGCRLMWVRFRQNNGQWTWLGEMRDVK